MVSFLTSVISSPKILEIRGDLFVSMLSKLAFSMQFWSFILKEYEPKLEMINRRTGMSKRGAEQASHQEESCRLPLYNQPSQLEWEAQCDCFSQIC